MEKADILKLLIEQKCDELDLLLELLEKEIGHEEFEKYTGNGCIYCGS